MQDPLKPKYYRILQVCQIYGIGRTKVAELIKQGQLKAVKVGSATLVDAGAADAFFSQLPLAHKARR